MTHTTPMIYWKNHDWTAWLSAMRSSTKTVNRKPTDKQFNAMAKWKVPAWVFPDLSRSMASAIIGRLIREADQWRREQAAAKTRAQPQRPAHVTIQVSMNPPSPASMMTGSVEDARWAENIRTFISPWLTSRIASNPTMAEVIDYMVSSITDSRFWIAHRAADMKPDELQAMLEDATLRMKLAKLAQPRSGYVDFGSPEFDSPEDDEEEEEWDD